MPVVLPSMPAREARTSETVASSDDYGPVIAAVPDRVAWWRLDDADATALDVERTQNGTYHGGVTLKQAPLPANTANPDVVLDGTGYVEIPHVAELALASGTAMMWFRLTSLSANRTFLSKDASSIAEGDFIFWYVQASNQLRFQLEDTIEAHRANAEGALDPDVTYCGVISWGAAGMRVYLASGEVVRLVATNSYAGGMSANTRNLRIGATHWQGAPGDFFVGQMGDVVLWKRQLTDAEIEAVTQSQLVPSAGYEGVVAAATSYSTLVAWYKLDGILPIEDAQGNVGRGVITGGITFAPAGLPDTDDIGADFDGSTGFVTIADDRALHRSECAIHLAVDIHAFPAPGQAMQILSKEGTGLVDQDMVLSVFNNAGVPEIRANFIQTSTAQRVTYSGLSLGKHWLTLNIGGGRALELFVDAISRDTEPAYTVGINANTRPLRLGAADFGAGVTGFFDGRIKHLQVYIRRLTPAEIKTLSPSIATAPTSALGRLVWQDDLQDTAAHNIGDTVTQGLFSEWGTILEQFKPGNTTLQNAPGGGRALRMTVPNGDRDSSSLRFDTVAFANNGVEIVDVASEAEVYVPSTNWPGSGTRGYYGISFAAGHNAHLPPRSPGAITDDPNSPRFLILNWEGATIDEGLSVYSYYVNKPTKFGHKLVATPNFFLSDHLNEWIRFRLECTGGHGQADGTVRVYINGDLVHTRTGMQFHEDPNFGWRMMGLVTYFHDRNKTGSAYSVYIRNVKMYDISNV